MSRRKRQKTGMINNENENNSMAQEPQTPQQTVDAQPGGYTAGERAHLDIEIITPDRVFYKGETDFLEFNTQNGEIDVKRAEFALRKALIRIDVSHHI